MLQGRAENQEGEAAKDGEPASDEPKQSAALLAFALLESVAAVAGLAIRAIVGLALDEVAEAREDLPRVQADKPRVGSDEAADEGLGGKIGVVVGFQRM